MKTYSGALDTPQSPASLLALYDTKHKREMERKKNYIL